LPLSSPGRSFFAAGVRGAWQPGKGGALKSSWKIGEAKESVMRKLMLLCVSFCAMAFVVPMSSARAQNLAWVSPTGNDGTCTGAETSPCKTFAGAIALGGVAQINCLGSGSYGALNSTTVSISGSIIIDCGEGNVGEMTTNGGNAAININASASSVIVLRHLSLNGGDNTGVNGINTQAFPGGTLIVENCMISSFQTSGATNGSGIYFAPSSGRGLLQVSDSLLFNNGNNAINISPASGVIASATLNRDEFTGNGSGISIGGSGTVAGTVRQSVVAESPAFGIIAGANQVFLTVEESSIIDNVNTGIKTTSSGTIINVGASTIGGNGTGVLAASGQIISFGNNQMSANATDGNFTSTTPLK
jgi:hypothetical protein